MIPDAHKAGRSIVIRLLSWGCVLPLTLLATSLLTRYLGPEQSGIYALTFPVLTAAAILTGMGMDPLVLRQLSCQPRTAWSELLSEAAGARALSCLIICLSALLIFWVFPFDPHLRVLCSLGSISLFFSFSFNGLRTIYSHGFNAEQHVSFLMLLEAINRTVTALLIVVVVLLQWPLFWIYVLLVYSDIPLFIVQFSMARKRYVIRLRLTLRRLHYYLWSSLPLSGQQALLLLGSYIDICVIMVMMGSGSVGIYALASRLVDPLISIAFAYANGLYPYFCMTWKEQPARFAAVFTRAFCLLALAMIPLAASMTVLADPLIQLTGGPAFREGSIAVQLLMWAMIATFLSQVAERACMAMGKERQIFWVTLLATVGNLLLNCLLIPRWGLAGAGYAALCSESCTLVLLLLLLRPSIKFWLICGKTGIILLANGPALFLYLNFSTIPLFPLLSFSCLFTLSIYLLLRLLTWDDLQKGWYLVCVK